MFVDGLIWTDSSLEAQLLVEKGLATGPTIRKTIAAKPSLFRRNAEKNLIREVEKYAKGKKYDVISYIEGSSFIDTSTELHQAQYDFYVLKY